MNENAKSKRFLQHIKVNTCSVKSEAHQFKYHQVYGFVRRQPSTSAILPHEDSFDIQKCFEDFEKKMDKFVDKLLKATPKMSHAIRRIVRSYIRLLMFCALITFGYAFMLSMVESNPNIIEAVPNLTRLLQSMNILAGYTTDFLHWNFVWLTRIIEQFIEEVSALIS